MSGSSSIYDKYIKPIIDSLKGKSGTNTNTPASNVGTEAHAEFIEPNQGTPTTPKSWTNEAPQPKETYTEQATTAYHDGHDTNIPRR